MSQADWSAAWQDVNFGYMHEDPAIEQHLMQGRQNALCVLSAGDIAYAIASPDRRVWAADVNPAQRALHRLKIATAAHLSSISSSLTIGEALQHPSIHSKISPEDHCFWQQRGRLTRPLVTSGKIDAKLRFLARWIQPFILPRSLKNALKNHSSESPIQFSDPAWNLAWKFLHLGIAITFPFAFRRHLPADLISRLRKRFESTCLTHPPANNPFLQRLLSPSPAAYPDAFEGTLPNAAHANLITTQCGALESSFTANPDLPKFDLISTSNIFDVAPPQALSEFLRLSEPSTSPQVRIVVRSLFRDTGDWPLMPDGWKVDRLELIHAQQIDRAPLCRVSLIVRRSAPLSSPPNPPVPSCSPWASPSPC